MPLGKYHVLIIKEKTGNKRSLHLRGGFFLFILLIFGVLIAGNVWLFDYYKENNLLKSQLTEAERVMEERQSQLVSMAGDLTLIKDNVSRMQQFNAKLRLMMNMENDPLETGVGGYSTKDLSLGNLPLHRQELASKKIRLFLKELASEVQLEEVNQQELLLGIRANEALLAVMPTIWPVDGFVTSQFGGRRSPFTGTTEYHKGLDISAKMGTPIYAPARGKVTFAAIDGAYGNSVELNHGAGLITKYAHMQRFIVKEGETLERGDLIGYVGSTGRSTGPHLHYEVRLNGVATNPMLYILN